MQDSQSCRSLKQRVGGLGEGYLFHNAATTSRRSVVRSTEYTYNVDEGTFNAGLLVNDIELIDFEFYILPPCLELRMVLNLLCVLWKSSRLGHSIMLLLEEGLLGCVLLRG